MRPLCASAHSPIAELSLFSVYCSAVGQQIQAASVARESRTVSFFLSAIVQGDDNLCGAGCGAIGVRQSARV